MGWREAKSITTLKKQVNAKWPRRDRASDGTVGDLSHKRSKSDHNPNKAGVVRAVDIDADLSQFENVGILAAALQASKDPRVKYLIWNSHITQKGDITKWKAYTGKNSHTQHLHISLVDDPKFYDDESSWAIDLADVPAKAADKQRDLEFGAVGQDVRYLQAALEVKVDGSFGPKTLEALKAFQTKNKLKADGIAGANTRAALKI